MLKNRKFTLSFIIPSEDRILKQKTTLKVEKNKFESGFNSDLKKLAINKVDLVSKGKGKLINVDEIFSRKKNIIGEFNL